MKQVIQLSVVSLSSLIISFTPPAMAEHEDQKGGKGWPWERLALLFPHTPSTVSHKFVGSSSSQ